MVDIATHEVEAKAKKDLLVRERLDREAQLAVQSDRFHNFANKTVRLLDFCCWWCFQKEKETTECLPPTTSMLGRLKCVLASV